MLDRYMKLSEKGKTVFWLLALGVLVFFCLCPLFFLYSIKGYSYPLGWLLGSFVGVISYLSISKQADSLSPNGGNTVVSVLLFIALRIVLAAGALIVSGLCTFRSDLFDGFDAFSFYSTAAAVVLMPLLVLLLGYLHKKNALIKNEEAK